jgi:hypothetical protein
MECAHRRIRKLVETVPGHNDAFVPDDGNRYPTLKSEMGPASLEIFHL